MEMQKLRPLCMLLILALATGPLATGPLATTAEAGLVAAVGTSSKRPNKDFTTLALGWRFLFERPEPLEQLGQRLGGKLDLSLEPLLGIITGDADTVEFSLVPMLGYTRALHSDWSAFAEGGLGLAYTDLRGVNLGSRIQFASQATAGLASTLASGRPLAVGLRIRHISHAGLWAEANSGLNTVYLVFSFD